MSRFNLPNFSKRFIHNLLDLLFPRHCFGCGQIGTCLCEACLSHLPPSLESKENNIISVFNYDSPVIKQAIWSLKYKHGLEIAEILAKPLYETLIDELSEQLSLELISGKIILLPVPLSARRRRERGYNQAEELAKQIIKLNPEQFELYSNLIIKVKDTPTQVSVKDRAKRLVNLKGSFALTKNCQIPAGATIVIVDDVSTTGTTIGEVRRLLKQTEAKRVYGLVVAHS